MSKEFVELIVKGLVNLPEQVLVERTVDDRGVLISIKVAKPDMGSLIGREGATIKAIRSLVSVVGYRHQEKVSVKVLDA